MDELGADVAEYHRKVVSMRVASAIISDECKVFTAGVCYSLA